MDVLAQRRVRFDELVRLRPVIIRSTVQQILALPQFRLSVLYNVAVQNSHTFILFIAFQLRFHDGHEVWAVRCP